MNKKLTKADILDREFISDLGRHYVIKEFIPDSRKVIVRWDTNLKGHTDSGERIYLLERVLDLLQSSAWVFVNESKLEVFTDNYEVC